MRDTYLDIAIHLASVEIEDLEVTYRHTKQWLRGVTDYDKDGNYAWNDGRYAPSSYRYSSQAWPHRHTRNYSGLLHGEHIVPIHMVTKKWFEMIREGRSKKVQREFLDLHLEVIWITKDEMKKLNDAKLSQKMPENWDWGDNVLSRLNSVDIDVYEG